MRADRPALEQELDKIYFNESFTLLKQCIDEFKQSEEFKNYRLKDESTFKQIFEKLSKKDSHNINPTLLEAYRSNLLNGVKGVFYDPKIGDSTFKVANVYELNVAKFATYKAFVVTKQLKSIIENSTSSTQAQEKVRQKLAIYNQYQTAEYNTIVSRCRSAKQWATFYEEEHLRLFPNLMWVPSRSVEPRTIHVPFYNRIWAKDDPFWKNNQPGNIWNCKCDWVETAESITQGEPIKGNTFMSGLHKDLTGDKGFGIFDNQAPYFRYTKPKEINNEILKLGDLGFYYKK